MLLLVAWFKQAPSTSQAYTLAFTGLIIGYILFKEQSNVWATLIGCTVAMLPAFAVNLNLPTLPLIIIGLLITVVGTEAYVCTATDGVMLFRKRK